MLIVSKFKDGSVVRKSNSENGIGSIQVKDNSLKLNEDGFVSRSNRSAFIRGDFETLNSLGLKDGQDISSVFGNKKMIVKQSTEKFYATQNPKINPKTAEIIRDVNNNPIYEECRIVDINSQESDVILKRKESEVISTVKIQEEIGV